MPNELNYYDQNYNFLADSEDEDQIYLVENGKPVYRTGHQVETLISKLNLDEKSKILDYGCAKSSTMRALVSKNLGITPYLYDVSEKYVKFWKEFICDDRWATYEIPLDWAGKFDIVTTFFSLEHITNLKDTFGNLKKVLRHDGFLYAIVPNALTNPADLIVVDHPNHFTRASLERLLFDNGFSIVEIDDYSHRGAFVVVAKNVLFDNKPRQDLGQLENEVRDIGYFWESSALRIKEYEKNEARSKVSAIYGAGFYGTFIASNLSNFKIITNFLDQNPHLQGKKLLGLEIVSPKNVSEEVELVYVGLNPQFSKKIIRDIDSLKYKNYHYFYI
jgi:SAM-dependent methyltransferase